MAVITKEYEERVCDVCGQKADGEFNGTEYLNGQVYIEYGCPLDLCEEHMEVYVYNFSNEYYLTRGGTFYDEGELIDMIKDEE